MKKIVSMATIASLFTLAACTAQNVEPSGSSSSKIIGGGTDSAHGSVGLLRSVVQLAFDGTPYQVGGCTATLIGPRAMVTAAHCATDPRLWNEVSFDVAPNIFAPHGAAGWISAALIVHPQYDGDTSHGHDVAVVLLNAAPERPVVPLAGTPPAGTTVTAVGYGMNVFGSDGAGSNQRRAVDISILGVAQHELTAGSEGQSTCHGDSGGPILAGGALVGTTSYGDSEDCHGSAHYMRIDDNIDFLRTYVPSL